MDGHGDLITTMSHVCKDLGSIIQFIANQFSMDGVIIAEPLTEC